MTRGGTRAGAGRPKGSKKPIKPAEQRTKKHSLNLTPPEWEKYQQNGGAKTLRWLLQNDMFKSPYSDLL